MNVQAPKTKLPLFDMWSLRVENGSVIRMIRQDRAERKKTIQTTLENISLFFLLKHLPKLPFSGHDLSDPPLEPELSGLQRRKMGIELFICMTLVGVEIGLKHWAVDDFPSGLSACGAVGLRLETGYVFPAIQTQKACWLVLRLNSA
ncbi:hypothetical protein C0995_011773 [Termitomyces sp. Mi166|nr:hypothetical protein C0995_011773 [Termitomyces sp. Mi166\